MTDVPASPDESVAPEVDPSADLDFLGASRIDDHRWQVPVAPHLVSPVETLYGGAGIALSAAVAEAITHRPLRWVTCQFVDVAREGESLDVEVEVDKNGRRASQLHLTGSSDGRPVFRALVATGIARADLPSASWVSMPDVPEPDACEPLTLPAARGAEGTSFDTVERRMATGPTWETLLQDQPRPPGFRMAMWSRLPTPGAVSPAALAWIADFVPMSVAAGLATVVGASSLDNTLRMVERRATDWVLVDLRPTASSDGYAYGDVHLWTTDGVLLATGSQTAVLRHWRRPPAG